MDPRKALALIVVLLALSAAGCQPTIAYGRLDVRDAETTARDVAHASTPEAADADL